MITGINHINLSVADLEKSFQFYAHILGLTPLCKWPKGAYFLAGNDWFCINVTDEAIVGLRRDYTHYAFSVSQDDFHILVQKLKKAGLPPFKENRSEGDSYYFLDPDGHQLEIHVGDWRSRLKAKLRSPWPNAQFFNED